MQDRPLSPGIFANEFRRAQTRDMGASVGRRQALEYNSEFLQQMESRNEEQKQKREEEIRIKKQQQQSSSSKLESLS